ncbi:hypothetical protein K488DRAFT_77698 [Vararia minispora EC-137]|uniref:Uncharacterized protein n=1 Tax=Vararia minispora EC-137 TaxID=1314806 RepID=A0ACB8QP89_9AGAM|nr:hypothetical protein K488DRAFT_77698 [Vararia minispora EC-137]
MTFRPTDIYESIHWNMIQAHKTFERGYDVIASHLDSPPKDDLYNFLGYCDAWASSIEQHHDAEEATMFPVLRQKMDISLEEEQHTILHEFLLRFIEVTRRGQKDPPSFDAAVAKRMLEEAKENLFAHLEDEVNHLEADKLRAAGFEEEELRMMIRELVQYSKTHGNKYIILPYMRCHTPPEYKASYPGLPWFVSNVITPWFLAPWYSGYWKYAPYSIS